VRTIAAQSNIGLLYQVADWFIHPTLYDACANTVLQSMASGLPGLISMNDGATDLLRDGENGLLLREPQDPDDVLRVVKQALSTDAASRDRMATAARETVRPLTWQSHLEKWFEAIENIDGE
jgi:glycosyltransferase involved in cell wall biosynthesis